MRRALTNLEFRYELLFDRCAFGGVYKCEFMAFEPAVAEFADIGVLLRKGDNWGSEPLLFAFGLSIFLDHISSCDICVAPGH